MLVLIEPMVVQSSADGAVAADRALVGPRVVRTERSCSSCVVSITLLVREQSRFFVVDWAPSLENNAFM